MVKKSIKKNKRKPKLKNKQIIDSKVIDNCLETQTPTPQGKTNMAVTAQQNPAANQVINQEIINSMNLANLSNADLTNFNFNSLNQINTTTTGTTGNNLMNTTEINLHNLNNLNTLNNLNNLTNNNNNINTNCTTQNSSIQINNPLNNHNQIFDCTNNVNLPGQMQPMLKKSQNQHSNSNTMGDQNSIGSPISPSLSDIDLNERIQNLCENTQGINLNSLSNHVGSLKNSRSTSPTSNNLNITKKSNKYKVYPFSSPQNLHNSTNGASTNTITSQSNSNSTNTLPNGFHPGSIQNRHLPGNIISGSTNKSASVVTPQQFVENATGINSLNVNVTHPNLINNTQNVANNPLMNNNTLVNHVDPKGVNLVGGGFGHASIQNNINNNNSNTNNNNNNNVSSHHNPNANPNHVNNVNQNLQNFNGYLRTLGQNMYDSNLQGLADNTNLYNQLLSAFNNGLPTNPQNAQLILNKLKSLQNMNGTLDPNVSAAPTSHLPTCPVSSASEMLPGYNGLNGVNNNISQVRFGED